MNQNVELKRPEGAFTTMNTDLKSEISRLREFIEDIETSLRRLGVGENKLVDGDVSSSDSPSVVGELNTLRNSIQTMSLLNEKLSDVVNRLHVSV